VISRGNPERRKGADLSKTPAFAVRTQYSGIELTLAKSTNGRAGGNNPTLDGHTSKDSKITSQRGEVEKLRAPRARYRTA
jgi:hypothetical protein